MRKWIKCTNKLPAEDEECLVAFHIIPGDAGCGHAYSLATFHEFCFYSWEMQQQLNFVTHWMSLPDGPE